MRFGTYYFLQAPPTVSHPDVVHNELEQMVWAAALFSFGGRYFTLPEVGVIPKPLQQPHPPLYTVCVSPDTIEATALRGLPMLNSILRGPVDQLVAQRDTYVKACKKAGRSE